MTRLEQRRRGFNIADALVRGTAGVVLGIAGPPVFVGGIYDALANTIPAIERRTEEIYEKYPLINRDEFNNSKESIAEFMDEVVVYIATGREDQLGELAAETNVSENQKEVTQYEINLEKRREANNEWGSTGRLLADIGVVMGGALLTMIGSARFTAYLLDKRYPTNLEEELGDE